MGHNVSNLKDVTPNLFQVKNKGVNARDSEVTFVGDTKVVCKLGTKKSAYHIQQVCKSCGGNDVDSKLYTGECVYGGGQEGISTWFCVCGKGYTLNRKTGICEPDYRWLSLGNENKLLQTISSSFMVLALVTTCY